jgi:uncharacterized protein YjbI with pentapeptide repeats
MTEVPQPVPDEETLERKEKLRLESEVLRRQLRKSFLLIEWAKAVAGPVAVLGLFCTMYIALSQREDARQGRDDERFERAITRIGSNQTSERLTGIAGLQQFLDSGDARHQTNALQYLVNAAAIEEDATVRSAILDVFGGADPSHITLQAMNKALISARDRNRAILVRYIDHFFAIPLVNNRFPSGPAYSEVPIGELSQEQRAPLEATANIIAALIRDGAKTEDMSRVYCVECKFGRDDKSVDMSHINFEGAFLRRADFRNANLSASSFHNADLVQTSFTSANLHAAKLTSDVPITPWEELAGVAANNLLAMHGASFVCADLSEADFAGRPIFAFIYKNPVFGSDAHDNFARANLKGTNLIGFQFLLAIPADMVKDKKNPNLLEIEKVFPVTWGQASGPSQTLASIGGKDYVVFTVATSKDFRFTGSINTKDLWDLVLAFRQLRLARNLFEAEIPEGLRTFLKANENLFSTPPSDPGCKLQGS